jgi:hypothetical protein
MTKTIAGVVFAAGLFLAGCGGTEAQTNSSGAPEAATESGLTGVQCTNKQWKDIFWSDATFTTQVGTMTCTCFGPEVVTGVTSNFVTLAFEKNCSLE